VVGQGDNSFDNYVLLNLSIRLRVWVAEAGANVEPRTRRYLGTLQDWARGRACPSRAGCAPTGVDVLVKNGTAT
jgi:hypothetical protein